MGSPDLGLTRSFVLLFMRRGPVPPDPMGPEWGPEPGVPQPLTPPGAPGKCNKKVECLLRKILKRSIMDNIYNIFTSCIFVIDYPFIFLIYIPQFLIFFYHNSHIFYNSIGFVYIANVICDIFIRFWKAK